MDGLRVLNRLPAVIAAVVLVATTLTAAPASGVAGFGDVASPAFYTAAVQWMVDNDITLGTTPTCFSPHDPVTRGQAAAFMWRMEGEPTPSVTHPFVDVHQQWQQDPVSWMVGHAITTGTSATTFAPERAVTRGELAALLWRLAGEPPGSPPHQFVDVAAAWQHAPVSWMSHTGITTGTTPTEFSPDNPVTRAQVATFLHRYRGEPPVTIDPSHPSTPPCVGQVPVPPTTTTTTTTTTTAPSPPALVHEGTILTQPFAGSTTRLRDGEGMAYVPADDALWLADDNSDAIHEIDVATGELRQTIDGDDLALALELGGGPAAGSNRVGDLESLAYDPVRDHVYAFSGVCCTSAEKPTAFRLSRSGPENRFAVESYQPLADEFTAAAAGTPTGELVVSDDDEFFTYDYTTNTVGTGFEIPDVSGAIWGIGFSADGDDLYIVGSDNTIFRVDWATRTVVADHVFSVDEWMDQSRAVELVDDRLFVQDGDDDLLTGDPLKYAVHVFSVTGTG